MIIDAHQHCWNPALVDYDWLSDIPALNRAIEFAELRPLMQSCGVDATVMVQSADNRADSDYMFALADENEAIVGVVAWVPLDDPAAASGLLETWRRRSDFVGIRNLIHIRSDPDWVVSEPVLEGLSLLERAHVPFDLVAVLPRHVEHVPVICERFPDLRIVVDHMAKPPIGADGYERWLTVMRDAARSPNVFAKLSGLYASSGDAGSWTVDDLRKVRDDALEVFGSDRLMFGSDWPISEIAGGYTRVTGGLIEVIRELGTSEREAILAGTATRFYGLAATA